MKVKKKDETSGKILKNTLFAIVLFGFCDRAMAKYPIKRVSEKSKQAVIVIGEKSMKRGDSLELFDDDMMLKCRVEVLKVSKEVAMISTANCEFDISNKNMVTDVNIDSGDKEYAPEKKDSNPEPESKAIVISPYFEGAVGPEINKEKTSDVEGSSRGLGFWGIFSLSKKREFSFLLSASSGSGDASFGGSTDFDFEYSSGRAAFILAPTYFSSVIRPVLIYSTVSESGDFELFKGVHIKSERKKKIVEYGLQYDFSDKRENDFFKLSFNRVESKQETAFGSYSDDTFEDRDKSIGGVFRKEINKGKGWFQLMYTRSIDESNNQSKYWSINASIQRSSIFSTIEYKKGEEGEGQVILLNIMYFFDYVWK